MTFLALHPWLQVPFLGGGYGSNFETIDPLVLVLQTSMRNDRN